MALIGLYLFAAVPNFTYPLSSQEIDVGIAIRKDEADGKIIVLGKRNRSSESLTIQGILRDVGCVNLPSCTIACICLTLCRRNGFLRYTS
jgi:hypothetical protein